MQLENKFTIEAPIEKAWKALNTPEQIAPCFPGATLTEYEGESFAGTVKVKLGPISLLYKGKGTYVDRDDAAHRVVIEASGRDSRGNGTANATVTGTMTADGPDKTAVTMVTDMTITGRPAQFGRGVISDVADKIIGQFAGCVARKLAPEAEEAAPTAAAAAPGATSAGTAASGATGTAATTPATPVVTDPAATSPAASGPAGAAAAASPEGAAVPLPTIAAAASNGAATGATGPALSSTSSSTATPRSTGPVRSEIDAIDLLDTAGSPVLKALAPIAGGGLLLALVILLVRKLRG